MGHAPDQDTPGPGKQRGHRARRQRAERGCLPLGWGWPGRGQAHSQPYLLPRLITPRAADHIPHAPAGPHQHRPVTSHQGARQRSLAVQLDPSEILQGQPTQQTLIYPVKPNYNITSSLKPP